MAADPAEPDLTPERFEEILRSRSIIEQAKGILMERYNLDADSAFAVLVRHSQYANRKVRAIAEDLVANGELVENPAEFQDTN